MKVVFKDNLLLKNVLEIFKDAVVDANLNCRHDGLYLQAMDSSHISMASFKLSTDVFQYYECNESINLGLNLETICKVLKVITKGDVLGIESGLNLDKISVQIKNDDTKKEYIFDLKLMDIDGEELDVPPIPDGWRITIDSDEYLKNMTTMMDFGDSVEIGCSDDKMYFKVSGDTADVMISNTTSCTWHGDMSLKQNIISKFTSRLMKQYGSGKKIAKQIHFVLANDQPLLIRYNITENSVVDMFIAPKIDDMG